MATQNKKLGKFEVTEVANGYILGLINSEYQPGRGAEQPYYKTTYIAKDPKDLAEQMIAHLVAVRLE